MVAALSEEPHGITHIAGDADVREDLPVITALDVWFSYNETNPVLKGVTLQVPATGMTMLLGRSGSGKTTLLKLFNGLLRPQRGQIALAGAARSNGARHAPIAYIPQTLGLVRAMTALDNALTGALSRTGTLRSLFHSFPKQTVDEAREILAALGLANKMHESVYKLSGGQRQRVAIARALMQRPSLVLADEFVSQLDPITAEEILGMMKGIAARETGFLVTTHETDVVANYADRIVIMNEGVVVHDSPKSSLTEREMLALLR